MLLEAKRNPYRDGGWKIYDIADRAKPRLVHYERTAGFAVHRFDVDESYAYISTEMDGYIGNEEEILREVDRKLGPSRIFSFGVGTSVNRYLLDSMAREGGALPARGRGLHAAPTGTDRRLHRLLRRHPPRHQRREAVPPRQPAAAELQVGADRLSRTCIVDRAERHRRPATGRTDA